MARVCTICFHPERQAIEAAITEGKPYRYVSLQYGVGVMALSRHKDHIAEAIQEARKERQITSGSAVLERLANGERILDEILDVFWCADVKNADTTLKALETQRRQVELRAKIEGELDERNITVTAIPDWRDLRALLLDALKNHPQARIDVLRALEAYDVKGA